MARQRTPDEDLPTENPGQEEDFSFFTPAKNTGAPVERYPEGFEEPIVQAVDALLLDGLQNDASDIHLEPAEDGLQVRQRIDGVLKGYPPFSRAAMPQVISRLKLLAEMDIAERRLPQDGSIYLNSGQKVIHIRVSSLPTVYGEKLVLRLLNPEKVIRPLQELGFSSSNMLQYEHFLENTHGMILVTGPTGCGKTTSLYSTMQFLNDPTKNILTVENPVEFRLQRINQVQVNPKIGLTFAVMLRTVLRQDPDIIMVGEIRDVETAEIVTRAALTGHRVFSTLHTGDAARAVTRLLDMGVQPYLLTASLVGIVSQRLVRLICNDCRVPHTPTSRELAVLEEFEAAADAAVFYHGKGCASCNGSGFRGRTAIHEVMPIDAEIRKMIRAAVDNEQIRQRALSRGMIPLLLDGIEKSKKGLTTLGEVIRVAHSSF